MSTTKPRELIFDSPEAATVFTDDLTKKGISFRSRFILPLKRRVPKLPVRVGVLVLGPYASGD
jgi:hypothetical protein